MSKSEKHKSPMASEHQELIEARKYYKSLQKISQQRHEELSEILKAYDEITDEYGVLVCGITLLLGNVPPQDIQDKVVRDLMADIFDSLYESRRLLLESKLNLAYPLLRRSYESLSLLSLICNDASYAKKWESGKEISNSEVRKELAKHPRVQEESTGGDVVD